MFFYFWLIILYIPLLFIFPCRVIGRKNLPKKGKLIFSANHQTLNDPIIVGYKLCKRRFRYMAKAPLFKHKLNAAILKGLGAYPVHNTNATGDLKAIKTTLKFLKEEKAVCIFPEGARLKTSEGNELKHGVAMFSLKTNSPIVPAFFVKKTNAFVFNTLIIGKPIKLYEMEEFKGKRVDKEILDAASKIIKKEINGLYKNYIKAKEDKKKKKLEKKLSKKNKKESKA